MTKCWFNIQKLQELYDLGIDPFGSKFDRSGLSSDLKESGTSILRIGKKKTDSHVAIAGRLMTKRGKGKAGFAHVGLSWTNSNLPLVKDELAMTNLIYGKMLI
ncbi:hypothetical protein ACVPOR_00220 [Staphylococcus aureus]